MEKKGQNESEQGDLTVRLRDGSVLVCQMKAGTLTEELPPEMDFGELLRKAIQECGITQYRLARVAGVPQGAISVFLSGGDIQLKTFNRLAACMGFEIKQDKRKAPKIQKADKAVSKRARSGE